MLANMAIMDIVVSGIHFTKFNETVINKQAVVASFMVMCLIQFLHIQTSGLNE